MSSITYAIVFFFVLALVGHCCYSVIKIKKHLHMMQLNSYFNQRYFGWLTKQKSRVFKWQELEPLVALVGMFFSEPLIVLILFSLIYFRLFLARADFPQKKPLVFTGRATRLFVVNLVFLAILYAGLMMVWWHKGDMWFELGLVILIFYNFLSPIFLGLANILLLPLEKLIQRWYLHDAHRYINTFSHLKVVGITGSFGKTTTKYVLTEILAHKFNTLKTPGSYNTTMGVTKVIRSDLKPIHDIFVVEMSAKKPGDIAEICQLVKPEYGLITAIGEQHLETFKTLDNIKKTKNELIISLPDHGVAFFNLDDKNSQDLLNEAKCRVVTYGIDAKDSDYQAYNLTVDGTGSSFQVRCKINGYQETFYTRLLGLANIYNILAAIAVAGEVGMQLREMVYPVKKVMPIPHRLELKNVSRDIIFIDDAFNSNPVGSQMALDVLAKIKGKRKIIVTPGMIELGVKENEYNKIWGENIALVCDYVILVGKTQTLALQHGLSAKQYAAAKIFIADDFAAAKRHLTSILLPGDVVLFENDLPDNYDDII